MTNQKIQIVLFTFVLLTITACGSKTTNTPPLTQSLMETDGLIPEYNENLPVSGNPSTMYPDEDNQISTIYPAWEPPKVQLTDLVVPMSANEPSKGKTSISGLLYAFDISVPLANIDFILMPAVIVEQTPIVPPIITNGDPENSDIIGKTDENGAFYLDDITPGLYFLIINYPDHSVIAVESENTIYNRLFEFKAGESYPLGVIKILS